MGEILTALIGSTLTPVVVFLPLTFLSGLAGVFFRALGMTMVVSLLVSLLLALTLTPSLAGWLIRGRIQAGGESGRVLRPILRLYENAVRWALRHAGLTLLACAAIALGAFFVYRQLQTGFLSPSSMKGVNHRFAALPGTSLAEASRELDEAERIIRADPDVQAYSRQLGTQLGPFLAEPNVGSFLIKLKPDRKHTTEQVLDQLRAEFDQRFPMIRWDFKGFLTDLVGDLQLAPYPVEIRLFSPNLKWLEKIAPRVEAQIKTIPGLVDTFDGLVVSGPTLDLEVRRPQQPASDSPRRTLRMPFITPCSAAPPRTYCRATGWWTCGWWSTPQHRSTGNPGQSADPHADRCARAPHAGGHGAGTRQTKWN